MNYITIDGGTTNTRLFLVRDKKVVDCVKLKIGARANAENKGLLQTEIKKAILEILKNNNLKENDIERILASGMITSEFGLCHLEHIKTPAGKDEFHNTTKEVILSDISPIPFVFIRGVKTNSESLYDTDMMRGEETEVMGVLDPEYKNCVYVLPGSHSKIIRVNEKGKITDFLTTLTGEMIYSLSSDTILKSCVNLSLSETNKEFLLKGYDLCKQIGINSAIFKTRILKNLFGASETETYSFFLGAVLCGEIEEIIKSGAETVVLGGKAQIKNAMAEILRAKSNKEIVCLDEATVDNCVALGAVSIYEG